MLRIPAAALFLLTAGAIGPASAANTTGGVKVEKASVVVVVKVECKDRCSSPKY